MPHNSGRRVLVTGAGSGIGKAIACYLAEHGDEVVGTIRPSENSKADIERIKDLNSQARESQLPLSYYNLELTNNDSISDTATHILDGGGIDILVNNAGIGVFGPIEAFDAETIDNQFQVNVTGPIKLTRMLLPTLRERRGQIIWIGSLVNYVPLPFQACYSATKSAVATLSDSMRMELKPFDVRVSCVEPSDFATRFPDNRVLASKIPDIYRQKFDSSLCIAEKRERAAPDPRWVARVVHKMSHQKSPGLRRPVGEFARLIRLLTRILPDRVREYILSRMFSG